MLQKNPNKTTFKQSVINFTIPEKMVGEKKIFFYRKFLNLWLKKINYQPVNNSKIVPEITSDYPRKFETKWVRKIFSSKEKNQNTAS